MLYVLVGANVMLSLMCLIFTIMLGSWWTTSCGVITAAIAMWYWHCGRIAIARYIRFVEEDSIEG